MSANTIAVGTLKGLFIFDRNGDGWTCREPQFNGQSVFATQFIGGSLWAAPFTEWTGQMLCRSEDGGRTWETMEHPLKFPEETETALKKIWQITALGDRLFAGVEPSALFTSDDGGKSWQLCEGLWNHPHRAQWGPGFGGLCMHTVLPIDENNWVVATSTGGCYKTSDGGGTWTAANKNIVAPFLPDPEPEFGQCVHKIAYDPSNPNRLFLQHHWGVYRSDDGGTTWTRTNSENKLRQRAWYYTHVRADPQEENVVYALNTSLYRSIDGGTTFTEIPVPHGECKHAYGYKFSAHGKTIVVSGDTAKSDAILDAARGADILVHEVISAEGLKTRAPEWQAYHHAYHTTTTELAEIAREAKPKLLVLYHQLYQGGHKATDGDVALIAEIRAAGFEGEIVSAKDLDVFEP